MIQKAYYMLKTIPYREWTMDHDVFVKVYEIQNMKHEKVISIANTHTDLCFLVNNRDVKLMRNGPNDCEKESCISDFEYCLGFRLRDGGFSINIKEESWREIEKSVRDILLNRTIESNQKIEIILSCFQKSMIIKSNPVVEEIKNEMDRKKGCMEVGQYLQKLPYSTRYIEKMFKGFTGMSVKKYGSIIRIQYAMHMIDSHEIEKCDKLGFYDQTHLIKDFKRFISVSPGEYAKQKDYVSR